MNSYNSLNSFEKKERIIEIFKVFLKLGTTAFGGPASHVAMMEEEIVNKRNWLSREKFLDLYGATNLIPGPNSTELAIHLSLERGGVLGLIVGGISFIFPAMLSVLALAIFYTKYGEIPSLSGILVGIKPVIISIVFLALFRLSKTLLKNKINFLFFLIAFIMSFLGIKELPVLFTCGFLMYAYKSYKNRTFSLIPLPFIALGVASTTYIEKLNNTKIFLIFLKIGSVLYGSGYVLLAFLESEFVDKIPAITTSQLIDAVAIGQFTPGPVFTTATFIGYLLNGTSGAIFATIGIFLPSFILVLLLNPVIPKLRSSKVFSSILDGVNLASLALMAFVTLKLAKNSITNWYTTLIFIISFSILYKTKLNSSFLIIFFGILGYFMSKL